MKYTIMGFSQKIMVESGLNLNDASILRFVVDFYHTGKMKKIMLNGKEYIWISYKYVSESLPIIHSGLKSTSERTKKKRVAESIDRLATAGVIEKIVNRDPQGTFVFVRIVERVYEQYIARVTEITVTGYTNNGNGATEKTVTKDKSIKDKSIKDIKTFSPELCKFTDDFVKFVLKERSNKAPKESKSLITNSLGTLDKLIRLDGFTLEYIREVTRWAVNDDFYSTNFFSLAPLRSKSPNGASKFANMASKYDKENDAGVNNNPSIDNRRNEWANQ